MKKINLAQGVKELRKRKGISQEELAKNSGLSLRTIQRVENGETEPTGETLKRISNVLNVTPDKLIDWDRNGGFFKKTVKTKYEYLHIFDNKLVLGKTPETNNLVEDYKKSTNNVFKSLMVFFISIPLFTALAIIFYHIGMTGLAVYSGAFAFLFLVTAFYTMLFTSGTSLIYMESIDKIKIQRRLFHTVVVISYKEFGRQQTRGLILEKDQLDSAKDSLLSEKLIEEKDIKLTGKRIGILAFIFVFILAFYLLIWEKADSNEMASYYGTVLIIVSLLMLIVMLKNITKPLFSKAND